MDIATNIGYIKFSVDFCEAMHIGVASGRVNIYGINIYKMKTRTPPPGFCYVSEAVKL